MQIPGAALFTALIVLNLGSTGRAEPVNEPPIYNESADAAKEIAAALQTAKQEHKRVLLKFGANWCIWCHRLHHTFETDPAVAAELKAHYVVVMVDVNHDHNHALVQKYGNPTRLGLPVLVVLDADGRQLTTEDSGKLEEGDHHSPEKVLAFLRTKDWPAEETEFRPPAFPSVPQQTKTP